MAKKNFKKKVNVFKGESNPFNMTVNRKKHCILGQKVKGTTGAPVISRAASYSKRKELWLKTKVNVQKANKFVDKRLISDSLSLEEQAVSRMIRERKNKIKKNIFNLNDEEDLTHQGTSLTHLTKFGDERNESEDEEQLDSAFVKQAHFGGFSTDSKHESKSHKDVINELIVESKQKKYDKKLERELNTDLTEKLDQDWKALHSLMADVKAFKQKENVEKNDPYDVITNELKFDMRATPSDRTKSKEEIEEEQKRLFHKLEEDRKQRMTDKKDTKINKNNYESADAILDDFDLQPILVQKDINKIKPKEESESEYSDSDNEFQNFEDENLDVPINIKKAKEDYINTNESDNIPRSLNEFEISINSTGDVSEVIGKILGTKLNTKSEKLQCKLASFFGVLIEYSFQNLQRKDGHEVEVPKILFPHMYKLVLAFPLQIAEKVLSFLDEEHEIFKQHKKLRKKRNFPRNQCLLLLKYCSLLFSVSDFRHLVITPAIIFINDILSTPCIMTQPNISSRLFLCSVISSCISESKRFAPEVLNFLNKVLLLAVPVEKRLKIKNNEKLNLILSKKSDLLMIPDLDLLNSKSLVCSDPDKISIIHQAIVLVQKLSSLYAYLPSFTEIFNPIQTLCTKLPADDYPQDLKMRIKNFTDFLQNTHNTYTPLSFINKKPQPLKMLEPAFESKFDKKDNINKKLKELKKVSQQIRKEERGMLKEMRRDAQMIASEKLQERLESDAERKRKVKELYHDLSVQEGEFKKMMKKKS